MIAFINFLWVNENSDSFWHFKLSFVICRIAKVAKLIDFWMFDNPMSNLLLYEENFQFWDTASLSFDTLKNSQLFGMSSLSDISLTTWDFRDFLQVLFYHLSQLARYAWTCVCWVKIVTIYLNENVKSFLIYTSVPHLWASFLNLRRNTLLFCYCWWVMINKVTFTAIINVRLRCSMRYRGFRALTMIMMSSVRWLWLVRALYLYLIGDPLAECLPSFHTVLLKFFELR